MKHHVPISSDLTKSTFRIGRAPSGLRARLVAILVLALTSACAPAAQQAHHQDPAPCTDSVYVQLKRQHPDSLSERAWERLQHLDQECAAARADMSGMGMNDRHGGAWMGMGMVAIVVMAVAMAVVR